MATNVKLYDYHFRAYNRITREFIGEFHWLQITPKEFNRKLRSLYGGMFIESQIAINWL